MIIWLKPRSPKGLCQSGNSISVYRNKFIFLRVKMNQETVQNVANFSLSITHFFQPPLPVKVAFRMQLVRSESSSLIRVCISLVWWWQQFLPAWRVKFEHRNSYNLVIMQLNNRLQTKLFNRKSSNCVSLTQVSKIRQKLIPIFLSRWYPPQHRKILPTYLYVTN